ncbi:MAG: hypothetical protein P1R58_10185 [bacterium]|nr:hypothetical protein [bacterium]
MNRLCKQIMVLAAMILLAGPSSALDLNQSLFDSELTNVRYGLSSAADEFEEEESPKTTDDLADDFAWEHKGLEYTHKSPTKAFLLSLAVPGAGQYYYGSKTKAGIFLGVEALSLFMYAKLDGDGKDLEDAFALFNESHWSRADYYEYLVRAYNDSIVTSTDDPAFTHTLPDSNTQQYYEMTGKYDQFSWGWDDAVLDGETLDDISGPGYRLTPSNPDDPAPIPTSKNRDTYQQMRADANSKLDQSKRMLFVTMFNHLASAFEAFITTKRHNDQARRADHEFANWKVRANLKSFYASFDTPTVKVSYNF